MTFKIGSIFIFAALTSCGVSGNFNQPIEGSKSKLNNNAIDYSLSSKRRCKKIRNLSGCYRSGVFAPNRQYVFFASNQGIEKSLSALNVDTPDVVTLKEGKSFSHKMNVYDTFEIGFYKSPDYRYYMITREPNENGEAQYSAIAKYSSKPSVPNVNFRTGLRVYQGKKAIDIKTRGEKVIFEVVLED